MPANKWLTMDAETRELIEVVDDHGGGMDEWLSIAGSWKHEATAQRDRADALKVERDKARHTVGRLDWIGAKAQAKASKLEELARDLEEALVDLRVASGCYEYGALTGVVDVDKQIARLRARLAELTGDAPDTSKYDIECPNCGLKIEVDPEDQ